jgi:NADPH2:quinone reductase
VNLTTEVGQMRALVIAGFGSPGQARIADVPIPSCGPGDVLIKVAAAGVNPVDWKECEGHLVQFYGAYAEKWTPGYDVAGTVASVGAEVRKFKPNDRVVAFSDRRENGHNGTFAEYVRVLSTAVSVVPDSVKLVDAAAVPVAGLTAYQALFRTHKAGLREGDRALIHGASGGVGSYAVQLAKARGVHVAATCSRKNLGYVRALGADLVIDYAAGNIIKAVREWDPGGVNAVIDCVSGDSLPDALDALRPNGRVLSIATLIQDGDIAGDAARAAERGFAKVLSIMDFDRIGEELGEIMDLLATGTIVTPPLRSFPLEAASEALQHVQQGVSRGKVVVTVGA